MKTYFSNLIKRSITPGLLILCFGVSNVCAQSPLDSYVREGLRTNLVVQQRNLSLQQAQQSLLIARSYFLPSITLLADYISAEGGRSINIPVGDLLNPVYSTLNQLTGRNSFPQIENVRQNFLPNNFYDARVRTSVPLINTDLYVSHAIQRHQVAMKQNELDIYKRQLVVEIKIAYFNYLMATQAVKIYESALSLVERNVQLNESLLKNGKIYHSYYLRSKSESGKVSAELNGARNKQANARKYFNFLLNKPLDGDIDEGFSEARLYKMDLANAANREEVEMLLTAGLINESMIRMSKLTRVPKINAFVDLGSQAYDWNYNMQSRYYLFGVQLSVPLFQGFRNNLLIRQNRLELQKTEANLTYTRRQVEMAAEMAGNDIATAMQNYTAADEQLRSAQSYYSLIEKGYRQGVHSLIEYLDARNQLTTSQLQRSVRRIEVFMAHAKLERETASYSFETEN